MRRTGGRTTMKRALRIARYVPAAVSLAGICYLALKPSPSIEEVPAMPSRFGRWLDHQDFLCNVAGFLVLTLVMHATFAGWPWRPGARSAVWWRAALLTGLVVGLECAQLLLPRRVFDPRDIVAGCVGVLAASVPWLVARGGAARPAVVAAVKVGAE